MSQSRNCTFGSSDPMAFARVACTATQSVTRASGTAISWLPFESLMTSAVDIVSTVLLSSLRSSAGKCLFFC
jgi:hypothetical protein